MNYAPQGQVKPVVKAGEFPFAAAYLEHGHIYGQCNGLIEAGGELRWVYDSDPKKIEAFLGKFPHTRVARSFEEILDDQLPDEISFLHIDRFHRIIHHALQHTYPEEQ